ncbi:MAG: hypothetical protein C0403_07485 [Desulfobacterium sp.]|nr:hypothetical protein [Desulfobacterium sp.]
MKTAVESILQDRIGSKNAIRKFPAGVWKTNSSFEYEIKRQRVVVVDHDHAYSGDKREQTVRYYGYYSNKCRGMRKKADNDSAIPAINHPELSPKKCRKNWVRLIQKIFEVDPLVCPKCQGEMQY